MALFVQCDESPGPRLDAAQYRSGFRNHVRRALATGSGDVLLIEPNSARAAELEALWRDTPEAKVVQATARAAGLPVTVDFFSTTEGGVFSPDPALCLTYDPVGTLTRTAVHAWSAEELMASLLKQGDRITLLSLDVETFDLEELNRIEWSSGICSEVHLTSPRPESLGLGVEILRRRGYMAAGRLWGEAGTGARLVRPESFRDRFDARRAQGRVDGGRFIEFIRSAVPDPERRASLRNRSHELLSKRRRSFETLDYSHGRALRPLAPSEVYRQSGSLRKVALEPFDVPIPVEPPISEVALACHDRHGVWPISFSLPKALRQPALQPAHPLSHILPGFPYSFTNEHDYLDAYAQSAMAISHRKAGWDCFRHLEILASGSSPLILDIDEVPEFSMVHYPKRLLLAIREGVLAGRGFPGLETRQALYEHAQRHLTSSSMALYILEQSGLQDSERVLFIDEQLPGAIDYLSLMTLIGLKQNPRLSCIEWRSVDYMYEDTSVDVARLYGRGFGVTRALSPEMRSSRRAELDTRSIGEALRAEQPDVVVVGSIARNQVAAVEALRHFPASRTIWIHGEDFPPSTEESEQLWRSGTHVFVRSIDSPGSPRLRQ